ncbi:MAG: helix-turn-helix transcriptional regulator [Nocardioides sp.]|uniref:TOBE domain-containing protein n=1 Tax=Nocardioides sp. TaxID=35761 RepID=UPI0039E6CAE3
MASYRIAEAADLLGVSDDTLRRWVEAGRISALSEEGRTVVAGADLARLAAELATAPDPQRAQSVSARNRLLGLVTKVTKDTVMAQVELICGPYRIVSLMSSEAADDLGLEPGVTAVASIKSTNVVVERP